MFRSVFFTMLFILSVNSNATIIDISITNTVLNKPSQSMDTYDYQEDGVLIQDLGVANTALPPTLVSTGIFLYDAGVKISMLDNSLFDLINVGWSNWAQTIDGSGVFYEDSNGQTIASSYHDGEIFYTYNVGSNYYTQPYDYTSDIGTAFIPTAISPYELNQTLFGSFGQNVEWVNITSHVAGHKVLDYFEVEASQVPEPTSLALLGLGLAGFGFTRKKKKT